MRQIHSESQTPHIEARLVYLIERPASAPCKYKTAFVIGFISVKNVFLLYHLYIKNSTKTVSEDLLITTAKLMAAPECTGMGSRENNSYIIFKWNIIFFVMQKTYLGDRVASNFFNWKHYFLVNQM